MHIRFLRLGMVAIGALLISASAPAKANWDRVSWGMTVREAQKAYHLPRDFDGGSLKISQRAVSPHSPLANLIEPDSRVFIHFSSEGGIYEEDYQADYVQFLVPDGFNAVARKISAIYGKPVFGADNEDACFDQDGNRLASDPSGVGHVLSICQGYAVFVDRRAGNAITLGRDAVADMFRKDQGFKPYAPYVTVRIDALVRCDECSGS